jgi:ABC-type proline/glycine betaine transport system permease subunit
MATKFVDPAGAVNMTTSAVVLPLGIFVGSKDSVTVTGTLNCCPSGPNVYGVPTVVAFGGGGAEGSAVSVIVTFPETAPAGRLTELSPLLTVPPELPTVWETFAGVCCLPAGFEHPAT